MWLGDSQLIDRSQRVLFAPTNRNASRHMEHGTRLSRQIMATGHRNSRYVRALVLKSYREAFGDSHQLEQDHNSLLPAKYQDST
jgi:hypothetical protein